MMTQACRRWKNTRSEADHDAYRRERNAYYCTIRHANDAKWKEFLSQAARPDVWAAFRYTNPRKAQLTPTLWATIND
jgi:hypothetical protein